MERNEQPVGAATVTEVIEQACDLPDDDSVACADIVQQLETDNSAPLLLIPALAVVTPLSGIPGFSSLCGIAIALIAAQMMMCRSRAWFPGWLLHKRIPTARLRGAFGMLRKPARWIDTLTSQRMEIILDRPLVFAPQAVCLICGATMPLLELVPLTSSLLGALVSLMAIAMLARDGVLALLSMLGLCGVFVLGFSVVS